MDLAYELHLYMTAENVHLRFTSRLEGKSDTLAESPTQR